MVRACLARHRSGDSQAGQVELAVGASKGEVAPRLQRQPARAGEASPPPPPRRRRL